MIFDAYCYLANQEWRPSRLECRGCVPLLFPVPSLCGVLYARSQLEVLVSRITALCVNLYHGTTPYVRALDGQCILNGS